MKTLLVKGGTVITMNPGREVIRADIVIEDDRIAAIGDNPPQAAAADDVLDAGGRVVIPGLIQAHIHMTQTLFRGLADDLELLDWLRLRIWPLEAAHTRESNAVSARLGAAELIRGGTTSVVDMGTVHHTEAIFETVEAVGLRGLLGKCMMDYGPDVPAGLLESTEESLRESEALLRRWHGAAGGRIRYAFAPRFAVSCTNGLMERVRDMARHHGVSVHTHSSENRGEIALVEQERGLRNVKYFHKLGMTGPDLILAHCIWLDDEEMRMLADTGTHAVHCPS
ncbi:MAG: amidohydrolase family protein, partial [Desulfovibrionaceae bacterium]|nr:amidohydrolase family protein [Desulfovibrionaceae bacterium]